MEKDLHTSLMSEDIKDFDSFKQMIDICKGLSLNQVCSITNQNSCTIQNWVKRGFIPHPINKKYYTKHVARVLLISCLKDCMYIEDINKLMVFVNGDVDDESDDSISEENLYKTLLTLISQINNYSNVDSIVDSNIENEKLNKCMKVFLNAYASSLLTAKVNKYLQEIVNY